MSSATVAQALWRQRYLVVLVTAIFVLIGSAVTVITPVAYQATATLYLDTTRNSQNFDVALQSAQLLQHDFIVLATQQPVVSEACAAPGSPAGVGPPRTIVARSPLRRRRISRVRDRRGNRPDG